MNSPAAPASPASPGLADALSIARYHIVLIAMTGMLTFGWLMSGRYLLGLSVIVGLDWFLINLMNRITDIAEDLKNGIPGTARVAHRQRLLTWGSGLLLFGSLLGTHLLWPQLTPWRILVQVVGLCYNYRLLPTPRGLSRFKELYFFKNFASAALFILLICCIIAEVGRRLHFDPLLLALAAGMSIRNLTTVGDQLHQAIEASSLPVYVVFFGVAGASIHLDVLTRVGVPALIFVATRATGFLVLGRLGAAAAGAPDVVRRFAGFGLLPQAGLALALSLLFARTFPEFGAEAGALTLGVVALNELLAPALYRAAIVRSGEAGQGAPEFLPLPETEDSDPGTPSPFLTPLAPVATPSEPPPAAPPGTPSSHGH